MMFFMTRIKKGKNIRIPEAVIPMLEDLRDKMKRTTHVGGMVINPILKLGDGVVVGWALAMTNYIMNPRFSVIDREDFADKLLVQLDPYMTGSTHDEKLARINLCVAAASQVSGYNADEPLRATTPEGGVS